MSDPSRDEEIAAARAFVVKQWTLPENWSPDGNEWIGSTLPPWGTRPRCPVIRNGHHCRKSAIPGGRVCTAHGGAAPQVKRRAKLRALQLVDPALGQLARIIAQPTDQKVALSAIRLTMDINGLLTKGVDNGNSDIAKALLMERFHAIKAERDKAEQEMLNEIIAEAESDSNIVDAEVVEELSEDAKLLERLASSDVDEPTADPAGEPTAEDDPEQEL